MSTQNQNAIYAACLRNNIQMVDTLMSRGADPNIIPNDGSEQTTMISTAFSGNLSIFKMLLNIENKYKYSFDWVCNVCMCLNLIHVC